MLAYEYRETIPVQQYPSPEWPGHYGTHFATLLGPFNAFRLDIHRCGYYSHSPIGFYHFCARVDDVLMSRDAKPHCYRAPVSIEVGDAALLGRVVNLQRGRAPELLGYSGIQHPYWFRDT